MVLGIWLAAALVWIIIAPRRWQRRFRKASVQAATNDFSHRHYGPRRLTVGPEGIAEVDRHGGSRRYWTGVEKVVRTPGHVLIFIEPAVAHVIPTRAFASVADLDAFVERIERGIAAVRTDSEEAPGTGRVTGSVNGSPPDGALDERAEAAWSRIVLTGHRTRGRVRVSWGDHDDRRIRRHREGSVRQGKSGEARRASQTPVRQMARDAVVGAAARGDVLPDAARARHGRLLT